MATPPSTRWAESSWHGLRQTGGHHKVNKIAEEIGEDDTMISTMDGDSVMGDNNPTTVTVKFQHELLESRLLTAMGSLRLAIDRIEAAKHSPGTNKHNLIGAICSLESAIDAVEVAEVASKMQLAADGKSVSISQSVENTTDHGRSTLYLNRSLFDDQNADDSPSLSNLVHTAIRQQETNDILSDLLEEESALQRLLEMSISLRQQDEDDSAEDDTIISCFDGSVIGEA